MLRSALGGCRLGYPAPVFDLVGARAQSPSKADESGDESIVMAVMTRAAQSTRLLGALALLFFVRVLVQLVQFIGEVSWLPSFEQWQSGALPYQILLLFQALILLVMAWVLVGVRNQAARLPAGLRRPVEMFGYAYGAFMVFRFVAGFTFAKGHDWLDNPLPSVFHIVLASFVVVWAKSEKAPS